MLVALKVDKRVMKWVAKRVGKLGAKMAVEKVALLDGSMDC